MHGGCRGNAYLEKAIVRFDRREPGRHAELFLQSVEVVDGRLLARSEVSGEVAFEVADGEVVRVVRVVERDAIDGVAAGRVRSGARDGRDLIGIFEGDADVVAVASAAEETAEERRRRLVDRSGNGRADVAADRSRLGRAERGTTGRRPERARGRGRAFVVAVSGFLAEAGASARGDARPDGFGAADGVARAPHHFFAR